MSPGDPTSISSCSAHSYGFLSVSQGILLVPWGASSPITEFPLTSTSRCQLHLPAGGCQRGHHRGAGAADHREERSGGPQEGGGGGDLGQSPVTPSSLVSHTENAAALEELLKEHQRQQLMPPSCAPLNK